MLVEQTPVVEQTMGLRELLVSLRRGRWTLITVTVLTTVAAGIIGYRMPPAYTAAILLSAVTETSNPSQGGVLGSMASQLGGIAALTGLSAADSKKAESVAILQSEFLTERYIGEHNLLPILYKKRWDEKKGTWKITDPEQVPTLWKANQFFKKNVRSVVTDSKTGLITLTITWSDPKIAALWANGLTGLTNDYLRSKSIAESEASIDFLTGEASKTSDVEARQVIYRVLESEIEKIMFAKGNHEFAFKIIDPAVAPERPSSLSESAWIALGFVVGLLLSIPVVLIRMRLPLWLEKTA
jgi:uncharacterized protein involved in exopolysaccharide biosynthesis